MRKIVLSYIGLLIVGFLDYSTGYEMRFGSLYLLLVAVTSWTLRPFQLAIYSVVVVTVWMSANLLAGLHFSRVWLLYWNFGNQFASVGMTAIVITLVRRTLRRQSQLIRELRKISLNASQLREMIPICRLCDRIQAEPDYAARVRESIRANDEVGLVGGICGDCLRAREERLANISVSAYFPPGKPT